MLAGETLDRLVQTDTFYTETNNLHLHLSDSDYLGSTLSHSLPSCLDLMLNLQEGA